jgi:hypothetical protein
LVPQPFGFFIPWLLAVREWRRRSLEIVSEQSNTSRGSARKEPNEKMLAQGTVVSAIHHRIHAGLTSMPGPP